MANNQDHVWNILRDVLELLAGAGIPTPERGYILDGGWSLALSDLRRLVNDRNALRVQLKTAIAERDALRAELARLRSVLVWLDRIGGLGLQVHARITEALAAHDAAVSREIGLRAELAEARECNEVEQYARLIKRIQQLEAELQVRDNMGNEVLRILREATGRRDFHSEMEAAEHAAKMLAEAMAARAQLAEVYSRADVDPRGYLVFRPIQLPPKADWDGVTCKWDREIFNAAIDAAMKEGK